MFGEVTCEWQSEQAELEHLRQKNATYKVDLLMSNMFFYFYHHWPVFWGGALKSARLFVGEAAPLPGGPAESIRSGEHKSHE